jgi:tryptophan-rich sensory protein
MLYVLMGIALFLVWTKGLAFPRVRAGLILFGVQMGLNALWSIAFFGLRSPLAGLVVIAALWLALVVTIVVFFRIGLAPGLLLVPYVLWVTFASVLNFSIYWLNR